MWNSWPGGKHKAHPRQRCVHIVPSTLTCRRAHASPGVYDTCTHSDELGYRPALDHHVSQLWRHTSDDIQCLRSLHGDLGAKRRCHTQRWYMGVKCHVGAAEERALALLSCAAGLHTGGLACMQVVRWHAPHRRSGSAAPPIVARHRPPRQPACGPRCQPRCWSTPTTPRTGVATQRHTDSVSASHSERRCLPRRCCERHCHRADGVGTYQ